MNPNHYIAFTINLIAVFSSPSIKISEKDGTTIKSFTVGEKYHLAIETPLIA